MSRELIVPRWLTTSMVGSGVRRRRPKTGSRRRSSWLPLATLVACGDPSFDPGDELGSELVRQDAESAACNYYASPTGTVWSVTPSSRQRSSAACRVPDVENRVGM